jgi:hypothetical protein
MSGGLAGDKRVKRGQFEEVGRQMIEKWFLPTHRYRAATGEKSSATAPKEALNKYP